MSGLNSKDRPHGLLAPSHPDLIKVKDLVGKGDYESALSQLEKADLSKKLDKHWGSHLKGVALLGQKQLEQGFNELNKVHLEVKENSDSKMEDFRLAGLSLKKIGWYYRKLKEYTKAFAHHNIRYQYMLDHGSFLELHDSLISLDVDSYYLKNMDLSEKFLKESIECANQINEDLDRFRSLGISYNNLGGTLYALKKFEEAVDAIELALDWWRKYEDLTGTNENKVVWAHWGVGDVFENWMKYLKDSGKDFSEQKDRALSSYNESLRIANERRLNDGEIKPIVDRIQYLGGLQ